MVIDHSYKISAFGDFSDIKPNAETMMYFFEKVKDYGLLPSVFQELQIKVDGAQPVTQQRIALLSSDSREKVSIASGRIDYEITATSDEKLDPAFRKQLNTKICEVFELIFNKFSKKSSRLALNTASFVINLSDGEITEFMSRYSNPISLYSEAPLDEWSTRLMVRKTEKILDPQERINVITNLSKAALQKQVDGEVVNSTGFAVNVDINTVPDNTIQRYSAADLACFIDIAVGWWDKIIAEMG